MAEPTAPDEDDVLDRPDAARAAAGLMLTPFKVAIIDADPAVHDGTRAALDDYRLDGRGLELISVHSSAEARDLLRAYPDIAVILLEREAAEHELVPFIRRDLANETVRIILRTGQSPERRVIVDDTIDDDKAIAELTVDALRTTMTATLRSYQHMQRLRRTRRGLELMVEAAAMPFDIKSVQRLAEGVLIQLAALLDIDCGGILVLRGRHPEPFAILAGSGVFGPLVHHNRPEALDAELTGLVEAAFARRTSDVSTGRSVLHMATGSGGAIVVVLDTGKTLPPTDRALVETVCAHLSVAFDNAILSEDLRAANRTLEQRVAQRTGELTAALGRVTAQRERLGAVSRLTVEILGKLAHDIKNPLAVVLGRAEILTRLLDTTPIVLEAAHKQIQHICDAARQLVGTADALISDAQADARAIDIRSDRVDLAGLVADVAARNRPLAEHKRQSLVVAARGALVIRGDPERLREALDTIVSNAVKYSPVDGRIDIEVERVADEATIRVTDEGAGLTGDDLMRLFERLSAGPAAGERSTGLGLSIAKRIVDLHGGRIEGAPAPGGRGSRFTIGLPVEPA